MSTRKEQEGSRATDIIKIIALKESLRDPLKRDNAVEEFRSLTPEVVGRISEGDQSTIAFALNQLLDPDILGIEGKADILCSPPYLQGRLDTLTDFLKVASGRAILDSMIKPPRNKK